MPPDPISLRPVTAGDRAFLLALYGEARARDLAATFWPEAQKQAFLTSQFDAQDHHYRASYPTAEFAIITRAGQDIGRLTVDRQADGIRLIDIILSAACRRQGVGAGLIRGLTDEARAQGLPVWLSVQHGNPAAALYFRLGFQATGDTGTHITMEWRAPDATRPAPVSAPV